MRPAYDTKVRLEVPRNGSMEPNDPERFGFGKRTGITGWWLNLTAPPLPNKLLDIKERERLRKAELTSLSILAVFCFLLMLVSNSLAHPATAESVMIMAVGLVIAAALNRSGRTRVAAYLVPGLLMLLIALAIVGSGTLNPYLMAVYDLFVIPIILTSLTADRRAPWYFAAFSITFIIADFFLQRHQLLMGYGAAPQGFDAIAYDIGQVGAWGSINRHVALSLFAAFFGWLGARSVDRAIARADRAEEIAELERVQLEQRRQLEMGVQQLLETHVRLANGDYTARANLTQDNQLWQVAASLNNLVTRLQKAGQGEYQLRRTEEEARRLARAMDEARAGKRPFWPAPAGTAVDLIIERIVPRTRQPLAAPQQTIMEQPMGGQMGQMPRSSGQPASQYSPASQMQRSGPSNPLEGFPPMPGLPDFPGGQTMSGSLDPAWGQPAPFSNPNRRQPGGNFGGNAGGGSVVPENPWLMPPDGLES